MPPSAPDTRPDASLAAAIDLLEQQGYDATSVDELAEAAGISRSTFFRRFGSKDDMVFADHDYIANRVEEFLSTSPTEPLKAVADAAALVFRHHTGQRSMSMARHRLLQQVPALRDRELVTSHRYERLFRDHLAARLTGADHLGYRMVATAAAVVAVHNAFLRQWLRDPDANLQAQLEAELAEVVRAFRPAFQPNAARGAERSIVVAVFPPGASEADVMDGVAKALRDQPH